MSKIEAGTPVKDIETLGLSPKAQLEHGVELLRDAEQAFEHGHDRRASKFMAAGMASCFTALWRQGVDT